MGMDRPGFEFRPEDPAFLADPFPVFARMRDEDPCHWSPRLKSWVLEFAARNSIGKGVFRNCRSLHAALFWRRVTHTESTEIISEGFQTEGRASPIVAALPISGEAAFSVDSMLAGDMFLPAALMISSFLRSTMRR